MEHYETSLQVGFDPYALLGLSRTHRARQNYDEAEKFCLEGLEKINGDPRFLEELATIYEAQGNTSKAEETRTKLGSASN